MKHGVQKAASFFAVNRASFSGSSLSGGMSIGHPRFNERSIQSIAEFRAPNLTVAEADFHVSILSHPDDFLYLDPPYRLDGGKEKNRLYGVNGSLHEGFEHDELFALLKDRPKWLMSYNDDDWITSLYGGFPMVSIQWAYSMSTNKRSNEVLIGSRDLSEHMRRVAGARGDTYRPPVSP